MATFIISKITKAKHPNTIRDYNRKYKTDVSAIYDLYYQPGGLYGRPMPKPLGYYRTLAEARKKAKSYASRRLNTKSVDIRVNK